MRGLGAFDPARPIGHVWSRYAAEAAISTGLGMLAAQRLTNLLFPRRSGKAAFAGVVAFVIRLGAADAPNWLHLGQAALLLGLAYGLFWPHWRRAG